MTYLRGVSFVSRSFLRAGIFRRLKKNPIFFNKSTFISNAVALDLKVNIYNGMQNLNIFLRSNMVGYALVNFVLLSAWVVKYIV